MDARGTPPPGSHDPRLHGAPPGALPPPASGQPRGAREPSPGAGAPTGPQQPWTGTHPVQQPWHPQPQQWQQQPPPSSTPRPPRRRDDGRTTFGRVLRVWWAGRIRRLLPRGVPWAATAFAVLLLAAWVLFADILITPGVVMAYPGEVPSRDWAHDVIGWLALMLTFGLGFAAATMLLQLSKPWMRWASVAITVLSTAIVLSMVATGPTPQTPFVGLPAVVLVATLGVGAAALAVLAALMRRPRVHLAVAAALAIVLQWSVAVGLGLVEPQQWVFLRAWTDLAFPVLVVISGVAIFAVAVYAQQVHARADRIGRRILLATWVPIVAAAVALVVIVLRTGILSGLFGEFDQNIWGYPTWESWPHAVVTGGLAVWLVARSDRRPLRPRGQALPVVVLSLMAGMAFVSFTISFVLLTFVTEDVEEATGIGRALSEHFNTLPLLVAIALLVPILVPWFRRSTGRVGAIVAIVGAVPLQVWLLVTIDLGWVVPRFAASPPQVAAVMVVATLALAIWGAARRRDVIGRHLLLRLAIIPTVTLHAGQLLPGVWKDDLEQALVVVLSLVGLLLLGAPRTGTTEGNARAIVTPFAVQMAVLGSVIVARTMDAHVDDQVTTMSVLFLTIPVATVLCCRLEDPSDAWSLGATTVELQTMRRPRGAVPMGAPVVAPVVAPAGAWPGSLPGASPTGTVPQQQPWPSHPSQQPPPHR